MWTQRLTEQFVRDGVVTPEDAEIVRYGLEALTDNILAFLLTALVGFFYGSLLSILLPTLNIMMKSIMLN